MPTAIILDMHGIMYCYDSSLDIGKSTELFEETVRKYSERYEKYEGAWKQYKAGDIAQALEIERDSVVRGLKGAKGELEIYEMPEAAKRTHIMHRRRYLLLALQIYEIPGAVKHVLGFIKNGYKIVVVATAEKELSSAILRLIFSRYTGNADALLKKIDIYNMNDFGSKKDPAAWKKIFEKYKSIAAIYEDSPKNLQAAGIAAKSLGSGAALHERMEKI